MQRLAAVAVLGLAAAGLAGCSSAPPPTASRSTAVCPSADRFSCYFLKSNTPVRGPRTIDGYRVVGVLPAYCTQRSKRCTSGGAVAQFYDPKIAEGSHPTGEYLEWSIRDGGPDTKLATYVTLAEEQSHDFGQLPKG